MRHISNRNQWSESRITTHEDGTVTHHQYKYMGYGWHHLMFIGTLEGVLAAIEREKRSYSPQGYGGLYPEPEEINPGVFMSVCSHSNSCD